MIQGDGEGGNSALIIRAWIDKPKNISQRFLYTIIIYLDSHTVSAC